MHLREIADMLTLPDEITITGAGLGGLAAAIQLARSGRRVTVLERRFPQCGSGFGIQITPNGSAVLQKLGFTPGTDALAADWMEICCPRSGAALFRHPVRRGECGWHAHLLLHRADLVKRLRQLAADENVTLMFNSRVAETRLLADRVDCRLSDGRVLSVPFLIAADGLNSPTRRMLNEPAAPPRSRYRAWRALVELSQGQRENSNVVRLTAAPGGHLVTYPVRGGSVLNVVAVREMNRTVAQEPPRPAAQPELLREFDRFGAGFRRVLERCGQAEVWTLPDSSVADVWFRGRSILIGDALHPMLPFLAQGGNMALEDAWSLCRALLSCGNPEEACARFRRQRETRIRRTVRSVSLQGRLYHAGGAADTARSLILRSLGRMAPGLIWNRLNWLFDYDVTSEA